MKLYCVHWIVLGFIALQVLTGGQVSPQLMSLALPNIGF